MRYLNPFLAAFVLVSAGQGALADPVVSLPEKFSSCIECHGENGISAKRSVPHIAGQRANYFKSQLIAFQNGSRRDSFPRAPMFQAVQGLTAEDIQLLADYFSAQTLPPGTPEKPELLQAGSEIFYKGLQDRSVPACTYCHGLDARGVRGNPRIAGQSAVYLKQQIHNLRSGLRGAPGEAMVGVASSLSEEEIEAVTNYVESK